MKMENKSNNSEIKYTGVRKRKWGKWVSEIRLPNSRERIWLGSYDSPEKAARAFDAAQFCLRGKSAKFNFPDNPPDIAGGRYMTPSEIQAAATRFANMAPDVGAASKFPMEENNLTVGECSFSYSPSILDGTPVEVNNFEMSGVETSFHEQLGLNNTFGSGNYMSDFGYYNGFDDFSVGEFYTTSQTDSFNYVAQDSHQDDDTYNHSLYQDSYLWNF